MPSGAEKAPGDGARGGQGGAGAHGRAAGMCRPARGRPAPHLLPGCLPHGQEDGKPLNVTRAVLFLAEKKMMSSASAAGTQQIYSQGSPFPPGHSGKAFRYVPARGRGAKGAGGCPSPGKPRVSELGSVCGQLCQHQLVAAVLQALGRAGRLVALVLPPEPSVRCRWTCCLPVGEGGAETGRNGQGGDWRPSGGCGVLTCTHQTPRLTRTVPEPSPGGGLLIQPSRGLSGHSLSGASRCSWGPGLGRWD